MFIEETLPLSTKGKFCRFLVLFHKFTLQLSNTVELSIVDTRCIAHIRLEVFQNIEIRIGFSLKKKDFKKWRKYRIFQLQMLMEFPIKITVT